MKTALITLIAALFTSFSYAQNEALEILDKAADAYRQAGGIKVSFDLNSRHASSSETYNYRGTAILKGNKFVIEIPDAITWFDGKTQWVYMKDTEEVNISTPDGRELQSISPAYMFSAYKKGYKLSYKGETTRDGKTLAEVEMIPEKQNSEMKSITIGIDSGTYLFSTFTVVDKSGMTNSLRVTGVSTNLNLPDSNFRFNEADYPNAEIVDLR